MITSDEFVVPGSLSVLRLKNRIGKAPDVAIETHFICWRPDISQGCVTPKEVIRFARWPASTPTGKRLREWLEVTPQPAVEPNDNTRTII